MCTIKTLLKIKDIKQGTLFLIVLLIMVCAFIIYLFSSNKTLLESQEKIKECHTEHIQKADSLYVNLITYNKELTCKLLECNTRIWADSLIKQSLKGNRTLSKAQYKELSNLLSIHFENLDVFHKEYDSKIQRDSLLLGIERDLLNGQTKTMIDLHLNKIEHEYSNITMWAAILTILFLVFSFYSIFKMDELIQQGNEGVKDIKQLKCDGEKEVEKLKNTTTELIENTEATVNTFIQKQQERINDTFLVVMEKSDKIEQLSSNLMRNFDEQRQVLDKEFQRISKEYEERIKLLLNEKNRQFQDVNDQMSKLITQTSTYINEIQSNNGIVPVSTEADNKTSSNKTESTNNIESKGKEEQR